MRRFITFFSLCAASLVWPTARVQAGVVTLGFTDFTYTQGGTSGFVDLTVSGDAFAAYNLQVTIAAADQSSSLANLGYELEFAPISTISSDTYNNGYVFGAGDSVNYPADLGNTTEEGTYYTKLTTGDLTANFDDVQPGSTNDVLARLDFQLPAGALQGKFDISVDLSNTNFQNAAQEFGQDYLTIAGTLSDTVTVGAAASSPSGAVPEPATFGMFLAGMTGLVWIKRRRTGN